jgi:Anti-sigma factor NepR
MNDLQDDEAEKLRREALIRVGNRLRDYYSHVMNEGMPSRLTDLLQRLLLPTEIGCDEKQDGKRTRGR